MSRIGSFYENHKPILLAQKENPPPGLFDPLAGLFKKNVVKEPPPQLFPNGPEAIPQIPENIVVLPIVEIVEATIPACVEATASAAVEEVVGNVVPIIVTPDLPALEPVLAAPAVTILTPIENPATLPLSFSRRVYAMASVRSFAYLALLVTAIAFIAYIIYTRVWRKNGSPELIPNEPQKMLSLTTVSQAQVEASLQEETPQKEEKINSEEGVNLNGTQLPVSTEEGSVEERDSIHVADQGNKKKDSRDWKPYLQGLIGGIVGGGIVYFFSRLFGRSEATAAGTVERALFRDTRATEPGGVSQALAYAIKSDLALAQAITNSRGFAEAVGGCKVLADMIAKNPALATAIAQNPVFAEAIAGNPALAQAITGNPAFGRAVAENEELRGAIVRAVASDRQLAQAIVRNGEFVKAIAANPELLGAVSTNSLLIQGIITSPELRSVLEAAVQQGVKEALSRIDRIENSVRQSLTELEELKTNSANSVQLRQRVLEMEGKLVSREATLQEFREELSRVQGSIQESHAFAQSSVRKASEETKRDNDDLRTALTSGLQDMSQFREQLTRLDRRIGQFDTNVPDIRSQERRIQEIEKRYQEDRLEVERLRSAQQELSGHLDEFKEYVKSLGIKEGLDAANTKIEAGLQSRDASFEKFRLEFNQRIERVENVQQEARSAISRITNIESSIALFRSNLVGEGNTEIDGKLVAIQSGLEEFRRGLQAVQEGMNGFPTTSQLESVKTSLHQFRKQLNDLEERVNKLEAKDETRDLHIQIVAIQEKAQAMEVAFQKENLSALDTVRGLEKRLEQTDIRISHLDKRLMTSLGGLSKNPEFLKQLVGVLLTPPGAAVSPDRTASQESPSRQAAAAASSGEIHEGDLIKALEDDLRFKDLVSRLVDLLAGRSPSAASAQSTELPSAITPSRNRLSSKGSGEVQTNHTHLIGEESRFKKGYCPIVSRDVEAYLGSKEVDPSAYGMVIIGDTKYIKSSRRLKLLERYLDVGKVTSQATDDPWKRQVHLDPSAGASLAAEQTGRSLFPVSSGTSTRGYQVEIRTPERRGSVASNQSGGRGSQPRPLLEGPQMPPGTPQSISKSSPGGTPDKR